jgi:hypothetical protein
MKGLLSSVLLVVGLLDALASAQRFDKAASDQARAFLNGTPRHKPIAFAPLLTAFLIVLFRKRFVLVRFGI